MPVNDHDELLARAERFVWPHQVASDPDASATIIMDLMTALRAVLAARPQPDDRPTWEHLYNEVALAREDGWNQRAIGEAVAGSATPTEREWVDDVLAMFDEGTAAKRAGSATPTGDNDG